MSERPEWTNDVRKIKDLIPDKNNPRVLTRHNGMQLDKSLEKFNLVNPIVIDTKNNIVAGHQRIELLKQKYGENHLVDVRIPDRKLTSEEVTEYRLRDNRNSGDWDYDELANQFDIEYLQDVGFTEAELVGFFKDEFEEEFYSYDDDNAEMPIVPKWNEKYSSVVIFCDNELDENWLRNVFDIDKAKDYKTSRVAPNYVIHVQDLQKIIDEKD